jgi:hypothetical protein
MSQNLLSRFARDIAEVIPDIDAETEGQYGHGIGSESEERQLKLVLDELRTLDETYRTTEREVRYPDRNASCDLLLGGDVPVEVKLLRYWRANGDPEPTWYTHVFSPFNGNTLLTDAERLVESEFDTPAGLLGLFYRRAVDDPVEVSGAPEPFTPSSLAEKVVRDIEFWHGRDAEVCEVAPFEGLQHSVHQRGAAITWAVE